MSPSHSDTPQICASLVGCTALALLAAACTGGETPMRGSGGTAGNAAVPNINPSSADMVMPGAGSAARVPVGVAGSPAPSDKLDVHVEDARRLRVEVLVLSCNQDCAD